MRSARRLSEREFCVHASMTGTDKQTEEGFAGDETEDGLGQGWRVLAWIRLEQGQSLNCNEDLHVYYLDDRERSI